MQLSRSKTRSIQGNPNVNVNNVKSRAILSESSRNTGSVQRLTAETERLWTGYRKVNTVGYVKERKEVYMKRSPKLCKMCNEEYTPTGANQKRCGKCVGAYNKKVMTDYYKANYSKKGYNQSGTKNNNWQGGIGTYSREVKSTCERCTSKKHLVVHHKNHNRYDNTKDNLETLCRKCHQEEHGYNRDSLGRFTCKV